MFNRNQPIQLRIRFGPHVFAFVEQLFVVYLSGDRAALVGGRVLGCQDLAGFRGNGLYQMGTTPTAWSVRL